LAVDADGTADVTRTDAPADLRCDVAELGAAYLGGPRLAGLAAAGRVHELRPGAVAAASRAFAGDAQPHCPEVF
jgi:predicted acetyltransferase